MKIGAIIDHTQALAAYTAAGFSYPAIPAGKNTIWHHFKTVDGQNAVIINQCGHQPTASDNEQQVNGCSLLVAIDPPDDDTARATLEDQVLRLLEIDPPRRGRPPGETGEAKQAIVKIRCDLSEKGAWTAKARREGLKLSEWLRRRANS